MIAIILLISLLVQHLHASQPFSSTNTNNRLPVGQIFDDFCASGKTMLSFVMSTPLLFDDCMKNGRTKASICLFINTFILDKLALQTIERNKLADEYFKACICRDPNAIKALVKQYNNCSPEERQLISDYLKPRLSRMSFGDYTEDLFQMLGAYQGCSPNFTCKVHVGYIVERNLDLTESPISLHCCLLNMHECAEVKTVLLAHSKTLPRHDGANLKELIKSIEQSSTDMTYSRMMEWIAQRKKSRHQQNFIKHAIQHGVVKQVWNEAIKEKQWQTAITLLEMTLSPRSYWLIKDIQPRQYEAILTKNLFSQHREATLKMLYHMALFMDGNQRPELADHLRSLLNRDHFDANSSNNLIGFHINSLQDELLIPIIYASIDSLAFSELVIKRVCKRWNELAESGKVVVNSSAVARQFVKSFDRHGLSEPWKSFKAIREADTSILTSILSKWNLTEWHLSVDQVDQLVHSIPDTKNSDPFMLAQMVKKIYFGDDDYCEFELPKDYSAGTVHNFIFALTVAS